RMTETLQSQESEMMGEILKEASGYLRQKTAPITGGWVKTRFSEMKVPPDALARMHKAHELLKAQGNISNMLEDTSDNAMDKVWSPSCWHLFPALPRWSAEPAFNVRQWQARPTGVSGAGLVRGFGVGATNTKGRKGMGDTSIGQDSCSISMLPSGWHVYCLFDGHGDGGHFPAARAARTLPYLLQASTSCSTMLKQGNVEAALFHAFEKVQMDLVRQSLQQDFSLQCCGCTAVCVLRHPEKDTIWVANLGDSKAILIAPGRGVIAETLDHKPSEEKEKERVESCGMVREQTFHDDGFVEERLYIDGEDYPGLCMTRSLGDLCVKQFGVIAEPEIVSWVCPPESYILIASDGVWDFLSCDEVCDLVLESISSGQSLEATTNRLLAASQEKWSDYDDDYCDDISIILLPSCLPRDSGQDVWRRAQKEDGCCSGLHQRGCQLM
ncbi:unnamed protein product, partial [Effrenium voratum]